jgi:hypothetical protein
LREIHKPAGKTKGKIGNAAQAVGAEEEDASEYAVRPIRQRRRSANKSVNP